MGLMRWLRGSEDSSSGSFSAGMAELGGFFSPGQRKQTEHVEQQKRLRKDVQAADSGGPKIDLERGMATIHKSKDPADGLTQDPAKPKKTPAERAKSPKKILKSSLGRKLRSRRK